MIKINFDKYGKIRNLDFCDEVIFKGNNRVNQIFVAFDDVAYNPNHYMTYSALINENDYEGNLTDLATAKTTIDGVEGYTFYLFSNLTAKAGELKLSVRLVDRTSERVLVSGIIPLVIEDTAISTYASVDITKTQYNALLTAFDELSQSIDATNFKTINGESIYGEGDIVVLTSDVMVNYVGQEISNVNDSLWNLSQRINDVETENAELNALIEKQDKKIKQLELASEGNILSTITESDSAYEVDVGVDTLPYATIDKIGGMTYKSENLLALNNFNSMYMSGASLNDDEFTITADVTDSYIYGQYNENANTKFLTLSSGKYQVLSTDSNIRISFYGNTNLDSTYTTPTTLSSSSTYWGIRARSIDGTSLKGKSFKIAIYKTDTLKTEYQPYFEGLRDSKVTEIISAGANLLDFDDVRNATTNGITYNIKDGIITLSGTTTSAGNIIIQLNQTINAGTFSFNSFYKTTRKVIQARKDNVYVGNLGYSGNDVVSNITLNEFNQIWIPLNANENVNNVSYQPMLVNSSTAPTTFKPYHEPTAIAIPTAIQNLAGYGQSNFEDNDEYNYIDFENKKFIRYGYYEGETWNSSYLETDIAEVLQDNVIEVESGGTLTFENEYKQDVPFTWTFQEKL